MYIRTSEGLGQGFTSSIHRLSSSYIGEPELSAKAECPGYQKGEVAKSKTEGHLPSDVIEHERGRLIADFGVNRGSIKDSVENKKLLKEWLDTVMEVIKKDPTARIRIVGYSDCVGQAKNLKEMLLLRRRRAMSVYQLLYQLSGKDPRWKWKDPRSRIIFVGSAPLKEYVPGTDNSTVEGRAKNRGVLVERHTSFEFKEPEDEPEVITAKPCDEQLIDRARSLLSKQGKQFLGEERSQRLGCVLLRLKWRGGDDRYVRYAYQLGGGGMDLEWWRVRQFINQLCKEQRGKPLSDMELLDKLANLDEQIVRGLRKFRELGRKYYGVFKVLFDSKFGYEMDKLQKTHLSIYSCYKRVR